MVLEMTGIQKSFGSLNVLKNIRIAAITVNPYSPLGYTFDHRALRDAMQEKVPEIPVIDVRM